MATKISISKAFEKQLREWSDWSEPGHIYEELCRLLDAAQTKTGGLAAKVFLDEVMRFRPVVLPTHNGAWRTYSRLTKQLRDYGVTKEQAATLGLWLKSQTWLRDDQLTVEKMIVALPEYLSRCLKDRPKFKRTEWDDAE